ncbi:MAG: LysM domain-containing protein [Oscillospiraceae bacterium]
MENKNMIENELENVAGGAGLGPNYYIVKKGDTLGAIAANHHTTVQKLKELNPQIRNINLIYPGDAIRLY